MLIFKQSQERSLSILLLDGDTPVLGLSPSDVTCYISKDGGTPILYDLTVGSRFSEVGSAEFPGVYHISFDSGALDTLGEFIVHFYNDGSSSTPFDQYLLQGEVFSEDFTGLATAISSTNSLVNVIDTKVDTIDTNTSNLTNDLDDIKGAGFDTLQHSLKVQSDDMSANTSNLTNDLDDIKGAGFDTLQHSLKVQSDAISANTSNLTNDLDEIKGAGFDTLQHSLKVQSDTFNTRVPAEVAQKAQLVGAGGTADAPSGVGLWDVLGDGSVTLGDVDMSLKRILGLTHENFAIRNQTYDAKNNLIGATVKIYPTKSDTEANTNAIGEYTISASYDSESRLKDYTMVKES